jgi:gamma-glutamyltranspeptidase
LWATFGVMGGFMQPQGHFQVISAMLDDDLNPQEALDRPRWYLEGGKSSSLLALEEGIPVKTMARLAEPGADTVRPKSADETRFVWERADHPARRRDGRAVRRQRSAQRRVGGGVLAISSLAVSVQAWRVCRAFLFWGMIEMMRMEQSL